MSKANKTTSFNRDNVNHKDLVKLHNSGYKVICPQCESEIVFQKSGAWCSNSSKHYSVHNYPADIAEDFRKSNKYRGLIKTVKTLESKGYTRAQMRSEILKYYPEIEDFSELIESPYIKALVAKPGYSRKKRSASRRVVVKGYRVNPRSSSARKKSKDLI